MLFISYKKVFLPSFPYFPVQKSDETGISVIFGITQKPPWIKSSKLPRWQISKKDYFPKHVSQPI